MSDFIISIVISGIGAGTAIIVSIIGALLANRNSIRLQAQKLKEDHYIAYIEALHNLASDNNDIQNMKRYTFTRDKMFIIANENVLKKILEYEDNIKYPEKHDFFLTQLISAIRRDLKIKDKNLPILYLKK